MSELQKLEDWQFGNTVIKVLNSIEPIIWNRIQDYKENQLFIIINVDNTKNIICQAEKAFYISPSFKYIWVYSNHSTFMTGRHMHFFKENDFSFSLIYELVEKLDKHNYKGFPNDRKSYYTDWICDKPLNKSMFDTLCFLNKPLHVSSISITSPDMVEYAIKASWSKSLLSPR